MAASGEAAARPLMRLDHLGVGEQQRAVVRRGALRPEEQLGRAQHVGVLAAVEGVAQDEVDELVEEERRHARAPVAHEREVGRLDAARRDQPVPEGEHEGPVLARVRVGDRGDLGRRDRRRGAASRRACSARSAAQASSGGTSSGRAR